MTMSNSSVSRVASVNGIGLAAAILAACAPASALAGDARAKPMSIERQGSFAAGGVNIGDPEKASLACDHGFVEFQIPSRARKTALLLWHSSSVAVWQQRWDGGEGFQSIFLRRRFPVYLWDGPRVGRANWGCEAYPHAPDFGRDQMNFSSWRFGTGYPDWFPGVQFPTQDREAWNQALRARYDEFDTIENARLQAAAAAAAVERIGDTVLVTNSAGGLRALLTAIRSDKVKAIVAYENPGYLFPEGEGPSGPPGRFGPYSIPLDDFKKLTRIPIQLVWGDNTGRSKIWPPAVEQSRQFAALLNKYGGRAEVVMLPDKGLHGNTHIPFADLNNVAVADQLSLFLKTHKLDR